MIESATRVLTVCIALLTAVSASAQGAAILPYKDLALTPRERAADPAPRRSSVRLVERVAARRCGERHHRISRTDWPGRNFRLSGYRRTKHAQDERDGHSNIFEAGASQNVEFHLDPRELSMVTETGDIIVAQGQYTVAIGGGQPGTGAVSSSSRFEVTGQLTLPE